MDMPCPMGRLAKVPPDHWESSGMQPAASCGMPTSAAALHRTSGSIRTSCPDRRARRASGCRRWRIPKYAGGYTSHAVLPGVADGNTLLNGQAPSAPRPSGLFLLDSGGGRHDLGDGARLESSKGAVAEGLVARAVSWSPLAQWVFELAIAMTSADLASSTTAARTRLGSPSPAAAAAVKACASRSRAS